MKRPKSSPPATGDSTKLAGIVREIPGGKIDEPPSSFLTEKVLLTRLPISRRTLGTWKAKGVIPFVKIAGRVLFHWASVEAALLRRQRGGGS